MEDGSGDRDRDRDRDREERDGGGEGAGSHNIELLNNKDSDDDDQDDNEGWVNSQHLQCLLMFTWQKQSISTSPLSLHIIRTLTYLQIIECHLQLLQKTSRYLNLKGLFTSFFNNNSIYNPLSWLNLWISMAISVYTHLLWLFIMPLVISVVSMAWLGNTYMQHCDGGNSMCLVMIPPSPSLILIFLEWRASTSPESNVSSHSNIMARCTFVHLCTGSPRSMRNQILTPGCGEWSLISILRGSLCTWLFTLIQWYVQPI